MDVEKIYQEYGKFIFRYLVTLTKDEHVAEELTQETFYQVIKSIDNFHDDGRAKLSTWLCQIAKNIWLQELNKLKKQSQARESIQAEVSSFYDMEKSYCIKEDKLEFFLKAHQLNEKQREILFLRLLGNLSFKEIGVIFGETENWARVTFYRVKQKMWEVGNTNES